MEYNIRQKILLQNLKRLPVIPAVAIPVNLGHIIFFLISLEARGTHEYIWRIGLIWSHIAILIITVYLGLIHVLHKKKILHGENRVNTLIGIGLSMMILAGVNIAVIDQWVTPAISPFIILCIAIAVMLIIPPKRSVILFLFAYGLFFFLLPLTQNDPDILLSNRVNGLTAAGLGWLISLILWDKAVAGYRQEVIIEEQNTALENSNAELFVKAESLKESNATKDKLLSIIAHDLKSPFNGILGFTDLTMSRLDQLGKDEIREYLGSTQKLAEQTLELLDNLLSWAQLQQESIRFKPLKTNLCLITDEVINLYRVQAEKKKVQLINYIPHNQTLSLDPDLFHTILRNLISNAIKFSNEESKVEVSFHKEVDGYISLCITDNGIGITTEEAEHIFDPDSDSRKKSMHPEKGTGLGLVLCQELARIHGGEIVASANPDGGAIFCIRVPENR